MTWNPFKRRATARDRESGRADLPDIEIWGHLLRFHRYLRRLTIATLLLAYGAIASAAYVHVTALAQPLVYYVDTDGRAVFGGTLGDTAVPSEVEARYVAKRFVHLTLGLNSVTVERDFAEAFNLMTAELQEQHRRELAEYAAATKQSFLEHIKARSIRAEVLLRRMDVRAADGRWHVRAFGRVRTWPLNAAGEEAGLEEQDFEVSLTLVAVPRTELTPNGLLVAQSAQRFFAARDEAAAAEETVPGGRAP